MSKTLEKAYLEMSVSKIPVPPPRTKINFEMIKFNKIMEQKRKHPSTVAEMALRGIKEDVVPLSEMMEIVKNALTSYSYKDGPKKNVTPFVRNSTKPSRT